MRLYSRIIPSGTKRTEWYKFNSDWELNVRAKKTQGQIQVSNLGTGSKRAERLVIESK